MNVDQLASALGVEVLAVSPEGSPDTTLTAERGLSRLAASLALAVGDVVRGKPTGSLGLLSDAPLRSWLIKADGPALVLGPFIPRPPHRPSRQTLQLRFRFDNEVRALAGVLASYTGVMSAPLEAWGGVSASEEPEVTDAALPEVDYVRRGLEQRVNALIRRGDRDLWVEQGVELLHEVGSQLGLSPDVRDRQRFYIRMAGRGAETAIDAGADAVSVDAILESYVDLALRASSPRAFGPLFLGVVEELIREVARSPFRGVSVHVGRAAAYVRQNLTRTPSAQEVAGAVGLSPHYLMHLLKTETGGGLRALIAKVRVDEAEWRLRNSRQPVQDLARELGFAQPSHFAKVFRAWTGSSPSAFRRFYASARTDGR